QNSSLRRPILPPPSGPPATNASIRGRCLPSFSRRCSIQITELASLLSCRIIHRILGGCVLQSRTRLSEFLPARNLRPTAAAFHSQERHHGPATQRRHEPYSPA